MYVPVMHLVDLSMGGELLGRVLLQALQHGELRLRLIPGAADQALVQ
jgi:hypothetical protein